MNEARKESGGYPAGASAKGPFKVFMKVAGITGFIVISIVVFLAVTGLPAAPEALRDYCLERGSAETGALNLVSAIYLGYRAMDTLGETVVMLLAIIGTLHLLGGKK